MLLDENSTTLAIHVFSLPFFLNAKSLIFAIGFYEKPPELTEDTKWPPSEGIYRHKDMKIFT